MSTAADLVSNYRRKLTTLKSETSSLIVKALREFFMFNKQLSLTHEAGDITHSKAKMYYQNFDHHITRTHRVVLKGWPLPKFCCPSDLGSLVEVQLLYESWQSGASRFRKLTDPEWKDWLDGVLAEQMEQAGRGSRETEGSNLTAGLVAADRVENVAAAGSSGAFASFSVSGIFSCYIHLDNLASDAMTAPLLSDMTTAPLPIFTISLPPVSQADSSAHQRTTSTDNPHGAKRRKTAPFADFVNTITALDGRPLTAGKKARKPCADKGKLRGMRKGVATVPATAVQQD
jgi:hypothetical protein